MLFFRNRQFNTVCNNTYLLSALLLAFSLTAAPAFPEEGGGLRSDSSSLLEPIVLSAILPDGTAPAEEPAEEAAEGPCLPLITIEGSGGQFAVMTAYITNPAKPGEVFGKPSVNFIHVDLNHGKHLESFAITETLWDRVELGYAFTTFDVGDTFEDFNSLLTGLGAPATLNGHSVRMHNFNARYQFIKEGDFDLKWMPAVTAGIHYKVNEDIDDMRDNLNDAGLMNFMKNQMHITKNTGLDVSLVASKMLTCLPRPMIVSAGARSTKSAHAGFLGFTDHRRIVGEFACCMLITDKLVVGAEYRQKPDSYDIPAGTGNVLEEEDDWWTVEAGYLVNSNFSVAVGYGHFGHLFNHTGNRALGVALKYEF